VGAQPELREVGIFDAAPAELDADVEEGRDAFASIHPASFRPFLLDVKIAAQPAQTRSREVARARAANIRIPSS
jgi:hypothetical protein